MLQAIRGVDASLDGFAASAASALDIGRTELRAAEMVARHGPQPVSALGTRLRLGGGSTTALVDRMVRANCLVRSGDPADRRKVVVDLTPEARGLIERSFGALARDLADDLSSYDATALVALVDFLKSMRMVLERAAEHIAEPASTAAPHP